MPVGGEKEPIAPPTPTPPLSSADAFSVEEMEVVMECLGDLLSDSSFIPSLFISFDCDPTKNDLIQPLVRYLCRCCR